MGLQVEGSPALEDPFPDGGGSLTWTRFGPRGTTEGGGEDTRGTSGVSHLRGPVDSPGDLPHPNSRSDLTVVPVGRVWSLCRRDPGSYVGEEGPVNGVQVALVSLLQPRQAHDHLLGQRRPRVVSRSLRTGSLTPVRLGSRVPRGGCVYDAGTWTPFPVVPDSRCLPSHFFPDPRVVPYTGGVVWTPRRVPSSPLVRT